MSINIEVTKEIKAFARHETFYPRYGWLTKIVDKYSLVFENSDHNELGVGKNMMLSMKFWGQAFKLVEKNGSSYSKTELSSVLIGDRLLGKDPYIENTSTLWILFYESVLPTSMMPTWRGIINYYNNEHFTMNSLELFIRNKVRQQYPEISENSLKKDVSCFINMFVNKNSTGKSDEIILSPFSELGYAVEDTDIDSYRFIYGPKPTLNSKVVLWSIIRFLETQGTGSLSFSNLCLSEDSPGKVYKLSTSDLSYYLEGLPVGLSAIYSVIESAGEKIFTYDVNKVKSIFLLNMIYEVK